MDQTSAMFTDNSLPQQKAPGQISRIQAGILADLEILDPKTFEILPVKLYEVA